jgi:hypothetical protein
LQIGLASFTRCVHNCIVRRTISLIASLSLTVAGSSLFAYLLFFAAGWKGWMIISSGFMGGIGALWLWADFIDATPNEIE